MDDTTRTMDTQRRKVYGLEHSLFHTADETHLTDEEANKLLKRAAKRFRTSAPRLEWTRGDGRSATYYTPGFIRIHGAAQRGTTALVTLHEFAHHMVRHIYDSGLAAHGPQFWRCYKEAMAWAGYFDGRYSMSKHRVKISSQQEFWEKVRARSRGVSKRMTIVG